MVVCLSTCWWAMLWPSASDYCMLALNQWPLRRWYYWAYTYSFTALNHCVKDSSQIRAFLLLTGSVNKETGRDICLLRELQIRCISRHKKYKIKQFEISIVIMSCLLSLVSRVTFHTRKSRWSLWRENQVVKSNCQCEMNSHCLTMTADTGLCICVYYSVSSLQSYCVITILLKMADL